MTSDSVGADKAASEALLEGSKDYGRTPNPSGTLRVRLDKKIGDHFHVTIFASGAGCGKLCLRKHELAELVAAHGWSADNDDPAFEELAREVGLGATCTREESRDPHCKTCVCGKRAPVQADMGHDIADHPDIRRTYPNRKPMGPGTIAWWEHEEAWADYARLHGKQQSAERLAERGGFGYGELLDHLKHAPTTWRPAGRGDLWNKAAEDGPARG